MVMPNTNVKLVPALTAAFVISIMFSIFQFTFIRIQVLINSYSVIYGSFSIIFIFLIWIRVFWFFTILGVHLAYLFQNVSLDINLESDAILISFNSRLYITLKIFEVIVKRYLNSENAITFEELKKEIKSSTFLLETILDELTKAGYLISGLSNNAEKTYSITKNIDDVKLKEIYDFTARSGEEIYILKDNFSDKIENIILKQDYTKTLRSLGGE